MTETCDPIIETQTRLKAAVDLVHLGRYVWDLQTNVFELDARMKAMWGLPPDAPVDYDMRRSAIHPDDLPRVDAAIAKLIDSRHSGVCDNEYRVIGITDDVERWINAAGVGGGPPTHRGFGMRLIEEALPYQLDAQTLLDFEPNGVLCCVTIRL